MQTVKGKGRCQGELPEDILEVVVTTPNFFMHSASCTRGKSRFLANWGLCEVLVQGKASIASFSTFEFHTPGHVQTRWELLRLSILLCCVEWRCGAQISCPTELMLHAVSTELQPSGPISLEVSCVPGSLCLQEKIRAAKLDGSFLIQQTPLDSGQEQSALGGYESWAFMGRPFPLCLPGFGIGTVPN